MPSFSQLFLVLVTFGFCVFLGALTWVAIYTRDQRVQPAPTKISGAARHRPQS